MQSNETIATELCTYVMNPHDWCVYATVELQKIYSATPNFIIHGIQDSELEGDMAKIVHVTKASTK